MIPNVYEIALLYTIPGGTARVHTIEIADDVDDARRAAQETAMRDHFHHYAATDVALDYVRVSRVLRAPDITRLPGGRLAWHVRPTRAGSPDALGRSGMNPAVTAIVRATDYATHCYECDTCRREDCVHVVAVDAARGEFDAATAKIHA